MKKTFCVMLLSLLFGGIALGQSNIPQKLKVFIDCSNTWCDMTFIRTEINIVDYLLDRTASDVHVLTTSIPTGGNSEKYQMIFYGQKQFINSMDTLTFSVERNASHFERRDIFIKYLKAGLAPFIAKTNLVNKLQINMKVPDAGSDSTKIPVKTKDPWRYWVMRVGGNIHFDADQVYKTLSMNEYFSVTRLTDKFKIRFGFNNGIETSSYKYDTDTGPLSEDVKNTNYNISHLLVKSIDPHWCYGYEFNYLNNTFLNYRIQTYFLPQIEYSFFPVRDVNNKYIALRYGIGAQKNVYYDTTTYDKTKEFFTAQSATLSIKINQKWGTINSSINYYNYLNNLELYNLNLYSQMDIRITGGLSFYIYLGGGIVHDQINLSKQGATEAEVLTRRKQLESVYNLYSYSGLTYRFGSKLNNFINPRFESNRYF